MIQSQLSDRFRPTIKAEITNQQKLKIKFVWVSHFFSVRQSDVVKRQKWKNSLNRETQTFQLKCFFQGHLFHRLPFLCCSYASMRQPSRPTASATSSSVRPEARQTRPARLSMPEKETSAWTSSRASSRQDYFASLCSQ